MKYEIPNMEYIRVYPRELLIWQATGDLNALRCPLHAIARSTPVENIRQIHPYLRKQTQFQKCKMMQAQYIQGIMKNIAASGHEKTDPIQSQFNPKQTQFKPCPEHSRMGQYVESKSCCRARHKPILIKASLPVINIGNLIFRFRIKGVVK
ncbi:MAG: hypothetical protein GY845_35330 [Planctomycetes bacterium]|nr:hypothetical protein [Planctomycetota bacterium]